MKALGIIIAVIAMMLFAGESTTWIGWAVQLGAGAVLAILFLIGRRFI